MPLGPQHIGTRVVVRHLLAAPEPGASATDVLGVLVAFDDDGLTVDTERHGRIRVPAAAVVVGKPVPERAATLLRVSADRVAVVAAEGWRPRTVERLGDWWLREAAGFTGRANSILPVGSPGRPLDQALAAAEHFYARHGLPPLAQVVIGSAVERPLLDAGWDIPREPSGVLVQVASVTQARRRAGPQLAAVSLLAEPSPGWLDVYGRAADAPAGVVSAVLGSGQVALAAIGDVGRRPVAIGRGVVTGDWLGLSAVEVVPERRRQGLARQVVDALLAWGAERGARTAYLQTMPDNAAALALYADYGFVTHHRYRYLAPGPAAPSRRAAGQDPAR
ncbi:MAG: GNAT family N-acetyltransferase [Nocardioidaceae bacterium]|nr:GNAT family N-acetyltransferase [Nocardioidaceae bacterium]